jgi:kynurenine formamidase
LDSFGISESILIVLHIVGTHVDTRYHFIQEYVEDGLVKIVIGMKIDNDVDIITKSMNREIDEKQAIKFWSVGEEMK